MPKIDLTLSHTIPMNSNHRNGRTAGPKICVTRLTATNQGYLLFCDSINHPAHVHEKCGLSSLLQVSGPFVPVFFNEKLKQFSQ